MDWTLTIGDRLYSSWSLRGWLLFARFGVPVRTRLAPMYSPAFAETLAALGPARTVPAVQGPQGEVLWDTLAIAETLAERFPDAGHWPADPAARAAARSLAAEMHSGFGALRSACSMNLLHAFRFESTDAVAADLDRLQVLWRFARSLRQGDGPWLFGAYSVADAFFAPVAARIVGYGLSVEDEAAAYVAAHIADPAFRRWRAMGHAEGRTLPHYDLNDSPLPWPAVPARPARALESGAAENEACPFSGKPVTHLAEIDGQILGFCNAFCRDKAVADADAWPEVAALLKRKAA